MSDFKYMKKDSYSDEDLQALLQQHRNYLEPIIKKDLGAETQKIKTEYEQKIQEISGTLKAKEHEEFLATVPVSQRKIMSDLLKVKDIETIKTEYKDILEPAKGLDEVLPTDKNVTAKAQNKALELEKKAKTGALTDEEMEEYRQYLLSSLK